MTFKILLLGKDGQVGWHLHQDLKPLGELIALGRHEVDFEDLNALKELLYRIKPDVLVNAVAYTAVDKAESEPELSYRINAEAVDVMAQFAKKTDAFLIHYSTDYVFDGKKLGPYIETDPTNPLNVYGQSKLAGEEAIVASGCRYLIARIGWVYAHRRHNFPTAILKRAMTQEHLKVVNDGFGTPTHAGWISSMTAFGLKKIIAENVVGIYHWAPMGVTNWYDYATLVLTLGHEQGMPLKAMPQSIEAISSMHYKTPAVRPLNGCLDTNLWRNVMGCHLPHWQEPLSFVVALLSKSILLQES